MIERFVNLATLLQLMSFHITTPLLLLCGKGINQIERVCRSGDSQTYSMQNDFTRTFERIIGRAFLRDSLIRLDAEIRRMPPRLEPASNPITRYLRDTSELSSRRIFYNKRRPSRLTDEAYFNFTSRLLDYLCDELNANENYKKQCIDKILARDEGTYFSVLAELFCAGFLKSLGQNITFNSSAESGMPDVVTNKDGQIFGHDAKLFADEDILFTAKVNRMLPDFVRDYRHIENITLQVMVSDVVGFNAKKLRRSIESYLRGDPKSINGIMVTSFDYKGNQGIEVNLRNTNFSLRIIPSQPLDQAVDKFSQDLRHAVEQIKAAGLDGGISWGFFTHDDEYGSKQVIVQQVTDVIPEYLKSGMGLAMIEVKPVIDDEGVALKCNVYQIGIPPDVELTQRNLEIFLDVLNFRY